MDKGALAERILGLVMPPPTARSLVGDLLEIQSSPPGGRFWLGVSQIFVATVWCDLREHPAFVLGLACRGALYQFVVAASALFALQGAAAIAPALRLAPGHPSWFLLSLMLVLVGPLLAGRWIARRTWGREIAVCVVMAAVSPPIQAALNAAVIGCLMYLSGAPYRASIWFQWWETWFLVPFLLGAAFTRSQRRRSAACGPQAGSEG